MVISFCLMLDSFPGTDFKAICFIATGRWSYKREGGGRIGREGGREYASKNML